MSQKSSDTPQEAKPCLNRWTPFSLPPTQGDVLALAPSRMWAPD